MLAQFRTFQLVGREALLHLVSTSLQLTRIMPGTLVTRQGADADAVMVLLSGELAACRVTDPEVLATLPAPMPVTQPTGADNGGLLPPPKSVQLTRTAKGALQLPGTLLCVLRACDVCGEDSVTRSNVTATMKLDKVAAALQARYMQHRRNRQAEYSEVTLGRALFSRRHGACTIATRFAEAVVVTPAQLAGAVTAASNTRSISAQWLGKSRRVLRTISHDADEAQTKAKPKTCVCGLHCRTARAPLARCTEIH